MSKRPSAQRTIAVDFDGVLHDYRRGWHDGSVYGEPVPGSVEAITKLVAAGYSYYVFTTRAVATREEFDATAQIQEIRQWLDRHRFPAPLRISGEKWPALAYIDDRAVRFTTWEDVHKLWT